MASPKHPIDVIASYSATERIAVHLASPHSHPQATPHAPMACAKHALEHAVSTAGSEVGPLEPPVPPVPPVPSGAGRGQPESRAKAATSAHELAPPHPQNCPSHPTPAAPHATQGRGTASAWAVARFGAVAMPAIAAPIVATPATPAPTKTPKSRYRRALAARASKPFTQDFPPGQLASMFACAAR